VTATDGRPYHVVEWSGGGGLGHYAFLLADAMARGRPDVTLFTREGHELSAAPHHQEVVTAWRRAPATTGARRKARIAGDRLAGWVHVARRVLRERGRRPVVHLQSIDQISELVAAAALRAMGATLILTLHNAEPHDAGRIGRHTQGAALRIPHGFVVHTAQAAEAIRKIRPGAPIAEMAHPSYRRLAEVVGGDTVARTPGRVRIGFIGMLRPYKGLEFVVDVVRGLLDERAALELRVAGRAGSRKWVQEILAGIPAERAPARLEYLSLRDLVAELRACDVVLLGHRSESESGIALLALGAGVPVLAPRMGALARLLGEHDDWLFPPGEVEAARDRVRGVLQARDEAPDDVRARALAVADRAPTWEAMATACASLVATLEARA
jgi:glycosyltransferase involved in cell wall biosynthesis